MSRRMYFGYTSRMVISGVAKNKARSAPTLDELFRALADPTRLRLLNLMTSGEVCVCYFVEILGTSQPKISRHLAYLRRAGLVAARRDGKWIHYRLVEPGDRSVAAILRETLQHLRQLPDAARLELRAQRGVAPRGVFGAAQAGAARRRSVAGGDAGKVATGGVTTTGPDAMSVERPRV